MSDQAPGTYAPASSMVNARDQQSHSCGCVGPQNGQPLCPCQMRGIEVVNGRYVRPAQDLGPTKAQFDAGRWKWLTDLKGEWP